MTLLQFAGVAAAQRTLVLSVAVLLGVLYVLNRTDAFDWRLYGLFVVVVMVLATNAVGFNVLGFLIASPAFQAIGPLLAIAAIYLGWRAVQAYRESNTTVVEVTSDKIRRR